MRLHFAKCGMTQVSFLSHLNRYVTNTDILISFQLAHLELLIPPRTSELLWLILKMPILKNRRWFLRMGSFIIRPFLRMGPAHPASTHIIPKREANHNTLSSITTMMSAFLALLTTQSLSWRGTLSARWITRYICRDADLQLPMWLADKDSTSKMHGWWIDWRKSPPSYH